MIAVVKRGKTGQSTAGIEMSAARRRRQAKRRRQEEAGWAARSGPVTVTREPLATDDLQADAG